MIFTELFMILQVTLILKMKDVNKLQYLDPIQTYKHKRISKVYQSQAWYVLDHHFLNKKIKPYIGTEFLQQTRIFMLISLQPNEVDLKYFKL